MKYDVFISYSSKDQKVVEGICGYLEARGIRCFVAYRDIPRGVVWAKAIVDALEDSKMMVVAFSDSFNNSEQVDREIELASEDGKPILTFRLSDTRFSGAKRYYLKNLNWIDAFPNPDAAFGDLYRNICSLLGIQEGTKVSNSANTSSSAISKPDQGIRDEEDADSLNRSQLLTHGSVPDPSIQSDSKTSDSLFVFDPQTGEFIPNTNKDEVLNSDPTVGFINDHEWVDLGLPSGLKWATCNLGASKPEEYGDYYAWGELQTKSEYTEKNCITFDKDKSWLVLNSYISEIGDLTFAHDVARKNWGASWRMPTKDEMQELIENTSSEWTIRNGVPGLLIKSKKNKNSIFLPAAGVKGDSWYEDCGLSGCLWSSTPSSIEPTKAYNIVYSSYSIVNLDWAYRNYGRPIRPVSY